MKRLTILLLTLTTLLTTAWAVIPDMKFRRLDTRDGLSNSQVNCVFGDSHGFVWIGTPYGLNCYDGYRFRIYYSDSKDTTTMKNNYVDEIFESYDGKLWLKQGMSYCIFDPVRESVDRNPSAWLAKRGITGGIEKMFIDSKHNFWVKTYENGLFFYNPHTNNLKNFRFGYDAQSIPKEFGISSFTEYHSSMVLTSTFGELICLNGEKGWVSWKSNYVKNSSNAYNDYFTRIDSEGNLWVTTRMLSTFIYVRKLHRWFNSVGDLMRYYGFEEVPERLIVWDVMPDQRGRCWLATDHYGLYVLDLKQREARSFVPVKGDDTSIPDITLRHFYKDRKGQVWICTYKNGVCQYTENTLNFLNIPLGDVNTICEDKAGNYWLGTNDRGIMRYDPRTGDQQVYNKQNSGFLSDVMVGSWAARDGSIWYGTYEGGLMRYHNDHWTIYQATGWPNSITTNNVWSVTEDKRGNIWLATLGGGVQKLDLKNDSVTVFDNQNTAMKSTYMSSIHMTSKGWIVAGSSDFYVLINPETGELIQDSIPQPANAFTISASSNHVFIDSRGLVWQGSASGMTIYDRKSGQVTLLDMKSGLYGSSVCSVIEDARKTMWIVNDHGIANVTPQKQDDGTWTFTVRSYNNRDGLQQGPYNQRAVYLTRGGLVLIGGQEGLDIINPRTLGAGSQKEVPLFSGLVLQGQEIKAGDSYNGRVILSKVLNVGRKLHLKYSENQFTIQLGSSSSRAHNRSRFAYRLKGFDDNWIKTEEVNPNITFMGLPSGSYTLCVRMLNDDGTMGDAESRLDITIAAPWYRSWLAWLFYIVLGAGLVYYLYRRQQRQMQRLREELERQYRPAAEDTPVAETPTDAEIPVEETHQLDDVEHVQADDDAPVVIQAE